MRKTYQRLIREYFCRTIFEYRMQADLTQLQMAERLCMDERSYIDLEHGKNGCSVVTRVLYLIFECPDSDAFLLDLERLYTQAGEELQAAKEPAMPR